MHKTLLLIDGSSYLYRAFYALPSMYNKANFPTGALYGIINMMNRIRIDYPTNFIACVFDAPGITFRNVLYPEYKATRKPMPTDLTYQIAPIYTTLRALGWPILAVKNVEADDVIGTLSVQATKIGFKSLISTSDKDFAQLVNNDVTLINTANNEVLDYHGVIEKFGIPPEQIIDYLSLVGDTVDNIPGVKKCGPKTATKWLKKYGSLNNLIAHAHQISGAVGENLRKTLSWLPQAQALVTINTNCDLSPYITSIIESLIAQPIQIDELKKIFIYYNFNTYLNNINQFTDIEKNSILHHATQNTRMKDTSIKSDVSYKKSYTIILDETQLDTLLAKINTAKSTTLNIETTLITSKIQLASITICCHDTYIAYIPIACNENETNSFKELSCSVVIKKLKSWLENPHKQKIGHNIKHNSNILNYYKITLQGMQHDILLESYIIASHQKHDINSLTIRHLNKQWFIERFQKTNKTIIHNDPHNTSLEDNAAYTTEKTKNILALHQIMWPQIYKTQKLRFVYENIEIPISRVLNKIERTGVLIDVNILNQQSQKLGMRITQIEKKVYLLAKQSFNLNSPKQLGDILFKKLALPIFKKTPLGQPSTNEKILKKLSKHYLLPKLLLKYRALSKLKSTYTDKLPKMINLNTGRIHTNYAQTIAVTGRLISNDPNLQNIPIRTIEGRKIREAFIAPTGSMIISVDYSQIELRIMAHVSKDNNMLKSFAENCDIHQITASEIFGIHSANVNDEQRCCAKAINFGLIYGMSAFGLANNLGIQHEAAKIYIEKYFQRFPGVKNYIDQTKYTAKLCGYVETLFGRRLWLPDINSFNSTKRQAAERAAINGPMQGTAADLIKLAMISVQNWLEHKHLQSKIIMQVHDELILEVPNHELQLIKDKLPQLMKNITTLRVPLNTKIGLGQNWEQAH